ncbi:MAG: phenylalanine--tRNA ligase subunit beta [Nitrospirae bacterium]|nr:phenylalanine--tRNA ligase subunit beta [Nitrospirota bacterium]
MKASYNWIKEFVDISMPPKELAHTLTMAGFEVEAIEQVDDDTIFDIGITPNRPDCLSIRGIAREISAIIGLPIKDNPVKIDKEEGEGPDIDIDNPDLCPRYCSRIVSGIKTGPSPEWLSKRLESCGIRSTSNIVDITNYILLELGQPMHAFDLDTLSGKKIVVRKAGEVKSFTTLDNEKRPLSKDTLLIWDGEKPVAIAGVMGGQNTEVSEGTVNVLLESAYFNPASVRRTSKLLNLSTESSYRFERGIDLEAVSFALDRAAQMITENTGGQVTAISDKYPDTFKPQKISFSADKVSSVIGVDIEKSFIEKTLVNLGFKIELAEEGMVATPPSFRNDVEKDVDIIEEVARLYGYDKIPSTLPVMQMSPASEHRTQELVKALKSSMVNSGFSEVINYSFMNPDVLDKLNLSSDDKRRNLIYIKNPLRNEDSAMRTSLIPALFNNISLNLNRGEKMLRFFEISRVFLPTDRKLPDEIVQMAAVFHKKKASSIWQSKHDGFYDLKGALENIFAELKLSNVSFIKDSNAAETYLHPGKAGYIMIDNNKAGYIGALHPGVAEAFDIKGDITVAEIYNIDTIINMIPSKITYASLPKYPYVERDAAIVVNDDVTVSDVMKVIHGMESDLIETVNLFDIYKGKPVPEDKKSLAFSIRYRSAERTLTDSEVDQLNSEIIKRLQDNLNVELRS